MIPLRLPDDDVDSLSLQHEEGNQLPFGNNRDKLQVREKTDILGQQRQKLVNVLNQFLDTVKSSKTIRKIPRHPKGEREVVMVTTIEGVTYMLSRYKVNFKEEIRLSPRECEVIRLVAKGLSNKAVALILEISPYTVQTYLRRIYSKLKVSSRTEMITQVLQRGLIER